MRSFEAHTTGTHGHGIKTRHNTHNSIIHRLWIWYPDSYFITLLRRETKKEKASSSRTATYWPQNKVILKTLYTYVSSNRSNLYVCMYPDKNYRLTHLNICNALVRSFKYKITPAIHPLRLPSPGALKLFLHDIILSSGPIFHDLLRLFSFVSSFSHSILLLY